MRCNKSHFAHDFGRSKPAADAAATSHTIPDDANREQVETLLEENPKFGALDKAIGKEGFKVILLLRLSPIFPFALSNYFYGVTSVDFFEYMSGTLIGFFPGTMAYVYTGTVSCLLLLMVQWWVVYGGYDVVGGGGKWRQ